MSAGVRVGAFGALLAAIFALAALAGRALDPVTAAREPAHHAAADAPTAGAGGLRLVAADTTLSTARPQRYEFSILDRRGKALRTFETEQGRRMHLIVVRRDLRLFQHVHPTQDARGRWSVRLTLPAAGVYHAFADFRSAGARRTLGVDLFAAGRFDPLPLPAPQPSARVDGYEVALYEAGAAADELRFSVRRGGAPVRDLQPYLGARGHLVMLRAGDLSYEHVHPLAGGELAFQTGRAQPGTYRLFLQFRHRDRVHTAAFTRRVTR